ncbi:hypothetical protein DRW03_15445 [Corallococcus sp. H22C18031201]|uniref:hypothetical protein n=1 Tax=Citreicoccus inhibens TaxID=2849499 RepID=UPI000E75FE97|nr:hypothetical protein [Citreicoccus inhibens]MBU8897921.1 hypothetical protein [Citreicoccus inhibens]RJS21741.1 hypothetical protein DRW03_15445 [Corallococcus sp. H22C18031201]
MNSHVTGVLSHSSAVFAASNWRARSRAGVASWVLGLTLVGCGGGVGDDRDESLGSRADEMVSSNGLSTNGLSTNGLSTNGLSTNGLSTNGLSTNGLSTNGFNTWFSSNPVLSDMVMQYVAKCAMAEGQTLTYTSPTTGQTYTWPGLLGLAPSWSSATSPMPPTEAEQHVVSACLAAHANKYGVHVSISVQGKNAQGTALPLATDELTTYTEPEACFFGNLFNSEGVFAANDGEYLTYDQSTVRTCGLSTWSDNSCLPITHVGACRTYCTLDTTRTYYTRCTYNGKQYRPITTRIRSSDIYRCGDGTCQLTEHCGTGTTPDSCAADCGACH